MFINKKTIPLLFITGMLLTGCGARHHHHRAIPQHILNSRVMTQVKQLNKKDHKLSIVVFNKHKQLIIYKIYKIKNIAKVQDMSAHQTAYVEKETKDHKLTPKVIMYKLSKQQKKEKQNHQILERMKAINNLRASIKLQNQQIVQQRNQEQALMRQDQLAQKNTNNNQVTNNVSNNQNNQSTQKPSTHHHFFKHAYKSTIRRFKRK